VATDTLTKETLPGAAQAAEDSAASAQAQHSHTDAVSAEIRVVVDASQYTAFVRGLSKSVAPLHEETHTVIVFPKGAVIRLTGTLVAGDRLVLTNQQNGLQALCRVVSMKAPAGVKGYAEVEFLQRVPGFWEENPVDEKCEPAVLPAAAPPKLQIVRKDDPVPAAPAEPAKAESKPATAEHAPAPLPFVRVPAAAPAASSDADDLLAAGRKASPKREVLGSRFGFEEASEQTAKPARLRRHWMVAVACVAALAVAAAGVKMMLRHPAATAAAVQQPAASGVNNPPAAPQTQASNKSNAMDAQRVVVTAQVDPQPLAPTAKGTSSQNAAVSKSPAPTQQSKTAAAWRMPIPDGKLVGPAARPNQAAEMKDVAPPTLGADAMPGANGAAAGLVPGGARATAIPAPPAGAPPPTGGRVQSPRLLTSAQPVYPPLAKKQGLEGDVTIEATIDATGQVGGMKVVSGPVALQQAAMDAMRLWKYEPAKLNGLAVSMPTRVIIRFKLH
jgi:TonB family protein